MREARPDPKFSYLQSKALNDQKVIWADIFSSTLNLEEKKKVYIEETTNIFIKYSQDQVINVRPVIGKNIRANVASLSSQDLKNYCIDMMRNYSGMFAHADIDVETSFRMKEEWYLLEQLEKTL